MFGKVFGKKLKIGLKICSRRNQMMKEELTKQDILELFAKSDARFEERLAKEALEREKSRKEFEKRLAKSKEDFDKRLAKEALERQKSKEDFNKRLGELTGTWGRFVEELVKPNSVELFRERGIEVVATAQNIKEKIDNKDYYQIDLLLHNDIYIIIVEVKSTLKVSDVKEHLERLEKIRQSPPKFFNLKGTIILGAVAGIVIEEDADKYAYRKGLYVLRQRGNLIEIANDDNFEAKEWKVE